MIFLRPLTRYADFSGRARRSEYWGFVAFESIVAALFGAMAMISLNTSDARSGAMGFFTCVALASVCALGFAIPHLAVMVRRLHDTDRSAWWLLLQAPGALAPVLFLTAIVGVAGAGGKGSDAVVGAVASAAAGGLLLLVAGQICNGILVIILWLRGTDGENRFGPDPRGPDSRTRSAGSTGLDADRIEAMLASARRETSSIPTEVRWKPDLDFGPMGGRSVPEPAPLTRAAPPAWPAVDPTPSFGHRRA